MIALTLNTIADERAGLGPVGWVRSSRTIDTANEALPSEVVVADVEQHAAFLAERRHLVAPLFERERTARAQRGALEQLRANTRALVEAAYPETTQRSVALAAAAGSLDAAAAAARMSTWIGEVVAAYEERKAQLQACTSPAEVSAVELDLQVRAHDPVDLAALLAAR